MTAVGGVLLTRRYALGEKIGAGGCSEVWQGTDLVLSRQVAIKLLHPGHAEQDEAITRFRAEARHAAALAHENIARVYDYGEPDPPHPPFLVMELVAGPSLAGALASGPLDAARSLDIVAQAASGLHAAHLAGLVHRDVKPANLLLAPGGTVKITDFGIAHAAGSAPVTRTGQLVGTPGYLAPERVMGASATPASDLYALGVVAYECLTGDRPFTGPALAVALAHRERPLPPLPGWVSPDVAALIAQLTAKDPADRPHSAGEVARWASGLAGRLIAGATAGAGTAAGAGVPAGDPAITVAAQAARYPAFGPAPGPEPPTESLGRPALMDQVARGLLPAPGPGWRAARPGRAAAAAVAAVVFTGAAVVIGSLIEPGPAPHAVTIPSATPSGPAQPTQAQATTVDVRAGALIGQPVAAAAQQLRHKGLSVRIHWRRSGGQPSGTVLSVRPAGPRLVGSLVTLTAALQPEQAGEQGNDQGGDGNQGNRSGGPKHRHPQHDGAGPAGQALPGPPAAPAPLPGQTAPTTRLA
jgi:eukaryotic-like serine/threonine-protein kinase